MPESFGGYGEKEPVKISKKPELPKEEDPRYNDADLDPYADKLSKKINSQKELGQKFEAAVAVKIINQEFARLKEANGGQDGPRDEDAKIKILEMAKVIREEDGLATEEATWVALAMFAEGNVRKSQTVKKEN